MNYKFEEYVNFKLPDDTIPTGKKSSVHYRDCCGKCRRFEKASEQLKKAAEQKEQGVFLNVNEIQKLLEDFLSDLPMPAESEKRQRVFRHPTQGIDPKENKPHHELNIDYGEITKRYRLACEKDIVWLKFAKDKAENSGEDRYLVAVASSNDINFDIPLNPEDYDLLEDPSKPRNKNNHYVYNTTGIIVDHIEKVWDTSFVLIIPLPDIPEGYTRQNIERAIGNYLIAKHIPIIVSAQ